MAGTTPATAAGPVETRSATSVFTATEVAAEAAAEPGRPVYAHRGGRAGGLVENTRDNFRRAAAGGSLQWETDVRFTSTNYPVLLHDEDLRRFGCPTVKIVSVSVPKARECAAVNGQTLTTLYEFITDLEAFDAQAMVELKTVPTAAQWTILETRLSPVRDRVVIESFLADALVAASQRGYQTAALSSTALTPARLPQGSDWYAPNWTALTDAGLAAMHAQGVKVVVWTPECADWARLPTGVDALISDDLPTECG